MERLPYETGRVVLSTQGRDEGRYFLVVEVLDAGYVLMADGLTRKLAHLKKKKVMHLRAKPLRMDDLAEKRASGQLLDSDLRKFLSAAGCGLKQPMCKEG